MKIRKKFLMGAIVSLGVLVGCKSIKEEYTLNSFKDISIKKLEVKFDEDIIKEEKIKIVIDPGHGKNISKGVEPISPESKEMKAKDASGGVGRESKIPEYEVVMNIGLELEKELLKRGYEVILTKRDKETSLSNIERADIGNEIKANLTIRLHCDGAESALAKGASVLVPKVKGYVTEEIKEKSETYGKVILESYLKETKIKDRGVIYREDLTGFNWSKIPVILLEMGFLSNKDDEKFLVDKANHKLIAIAIGNGLDKIYKNK